MRPGDRWGTKDPDYWWSRERQVEAFVEHIDPELLGTIRWLFTHAMECRVKRCPHLTPEQRKTFDEWIEKRWGV